MFERCPVRRWIAACACVWVIACGVLNAHHTATHEHGVTADGGVVHVEPRAAFAPGAAPLTPEEGRALLERGAGRDVAHSACPFTRVASPLVLAGRNPRVLPRAAGGLAVTHTRAVEPGAGGARFLLAPKTSPPSQT